MEETPRIYLISNNLTTSIMSTDSPNYVIVNTTGYTTGMFESLQQNWTNGYDKEEFSVLLWSLIDCFLFIAISTGNLLTIISITLSRRLSGVVSNLFILSLATSDLLVGLVTPYHMAFYMYPDLGQKFVYCMIRLVLMSLACIASLLNIAVIAVDRYIAIIHPLNYHKHITTRTARIMSLSAWILAITVATGPVYWNDWGGSRCCRCELSSVLSPSYVIAVYIPEFALILVTMCVVYFKIAREANKHAKKLKKRNQCKGDAPDGWKSVQVLMLVLGCFTISYTPYVVVVIVNTVFGVQKEYTSTVYKITNSLAMANSAINPLIYAWKNQEIKRVFSRILHCRSINFNSMETPLNQSTNVSSLKSSLSKSIGRWKWKNKRRPQSLNLSNLGKSASENQSNKESVIRTFSLNNIPL